MPLARARQIRSEGPWICGAVFVLVVAVYARSLGNAAVWDDRPLVVDNPYLRTWEGLGSIFTSDLWSASAQGEPSSYYRPLTMLTFWINALLGGPSVASFRLGNVLIHAANAVMIVVLLRKMKVTGWSWAGILAVGWAIAPICSEPVMWISGRFDPLVVSFALLSLLGARIQGSLGLPLTLLAIGCGILSKESFIVWLPLVVIDDLFVRRASLQSGDARSSARQLWMKYVGMLTLVVIYFVVRKLLGLPSADVATHTGVRTVIESFFFLVATFVRVLVWPTNLDPYRPYAPLAPLMLATTIFAFTAVVGATAALLHFYRHNLPVKIAAFGLAWFSLGTLPSALAGPNLDMVGDRYAYLPLIGLLLMAAALIGWVESRLPPSASQSPRWMHAATAVALALLASEAWVTVRHSVDWRDDDSLARSSLSSSPGNAYALYILGSMTAQRGDFAQADVLLARALDSNKESWRTWDAICFVRLHQDRLDEADQACRESLTRHPENPRGWVNLASVYVRRGHWRDASFAAERAVALKSRYGEARYLAAVAAANLGDMDKARAHLARGIDADPDNPRLRDLERQFQAQPH